MSTFIKDFLAVFTGGAPAAGIITPPQAVVKPIPVKTGNGALLERYDLQVRHFRGPTLLGFPRGRDFTVAFRDNGSTIEFATSVVHPRDRFNRKIGTLLAITNFVNGQTVKVPKVSKFDQTGLAGAQETLTNMFGF